MSDGEKDLEYGMLSVGQRLRRAREQKGLTLDDVAGQTRIPVRHLRSIEDGNWDELPAVTYTVGFGRAYGNAVGLNGAEIGRELRAELGPTDRIAPPTEYYEPTDPSRSPSRLLVWIALAIAVLLVAGYLYWRSTIGSGDVAQAPAAPAEAPANTQAAAPPPAASPVGQQVTLVAIEDSWLRVDDPSQPRRQAVRIGVMRAGERFDVPLTLQAPTLRVARPQVVQIVVGGRELGFLDTRQRTIGNVSLLSADLLQRFAGQPAPAGNAAAPAPAPTGSTRPIVPPPPPIVPPAQANGFNPML